MISTFTHQILFVIFFMLNQVITSESFFSKTVLPKNETYHQFRQNSHSVPFNRSVMIRSPKKSTISVLTQASSKPYHFYQYPDHYHVSDYWHKSIDNGQQMEINYDKSYDDMHSDDHFSNIMEYPSDSTEYPDGPPDDLPTGEIEISDNENFTDEDDEMDKDEPVLENIYKSVESSSKGHSKGWHHYYNQNRFHVPKTTFLCSNKIYAGYYADVEADCHIWHICEPNGRHHTLLCPNGTLFNQLIRVCDWWYNVDCPRSRHHYHINRDQGLINHGNLEDIYNQYSNNQEDLNQQNYQDEVVFESS